MDPQLDRVDDNFHRATGAFMATSKLGEVLETQGLYLTNCGAAVADYNIAFLKRPDRAPDASLDRAARYFEGAKLPYQVCVRSDQVEACLPLLRARGFAQGPPVPGMQLSPIPEPPPGPGALELRRVADAATLEHFQRTAFEGFGLPLAAAPLFITQELVELPGVALFAGYVAGKPVCTSALVATGGVAGIYWVATREGFRSRGYGEAVTWRAIRAGRELGCGVASLQASRMGLPVYERMGFVNDRDYARFDAPSA